MEWFWRVTDGPFRFLATRIKIVLGIWVGYALGSAGWIADSMPLPGVLSVGLLVGVVGGILIGLVFFTLAWAIIPN